MAIVGFNFTKMVVEKKSDVAGRVNITNNFAVKKVQPMDLSFGELKQKGVRYSFEFTSKYEPSIGIISLMGDVIAIESDAKIKEILDEWKKTETIKKETLVPLLNNILTKCNVQALILSKDINLPPPIQLPKVNTEMPKADPAKSESSKKK